MKSKTFFAAACMLAAAIVVAGCAKKGGDTPAPEYEITVFGDGHGSAKAIVDGIEVTKAKKGAEVTVTATADGFYKFKEWTVVSGGIELSGAAENPATFTMPGKAVEIKAGFEEEILDLATAFPDANFRAWVAEKYDTDGDGKLSAAERAVVAAETTVNVSVLDNTPDAEKIADLTGIEYFTALEEIKCAFNKIATLDCSANTLLTYLNCSDNQLTSLDMSENTHLTYLNCSDNQLNSLDVSANTALKDLDCASNGLTSLDVSANTTLKDLRCQGNQLTSLDLSAHTALTHLVCGNGAANPLAVTVPAGTVLATVALNLWAYDGEASSQITEFGPEGAKYGVTVIEKGWALLSAAFPDAIFRTQMINYDKDTDGMLSPTEIAAVTSMDVRSIGFTDLTGIEYFTDLTFLNCSYNNIEVLDISKNTLLTEFWCTNNQLTALDVSENTALTDLVCSANNLSALDVSKNAALTSLHCGNGEENPLAVTVPAGTNLNFAGGNLVLRAFDGDTMTTHGL